MGGNDQDKLELSWPFWVLNRVVDSNCPVIIISGLFYTKQKHS